MQTNVRCGCGSVIPTADAAPGSRVPCPGCARPFYVGGAHTMRDQRRSRLAMPALVLGLLPITAPLGLLLGIVATLRIGFSAGRRTGIPAALGGAAAGAAWTWGGAMLAAHLLAPSTPAAIATLSPAEQIMTVTLRTIGAAELEYYYKFEERFDVDDEGGGPRFWTADVAGLCFVRDKAGGPANLISPTLALADAAPLGWDEIPKKTAPSGGYAYRVLDPDADIRAGIIVLALPEAGGVTGVLSVTAQGYAVYTKHTDGVVPAAWPADPEAEGWVRR